MAGSGEEAAAGQGLAKRGESADEDRGKRAQVSEELGARVRCFSKHSVAEVLEMCALLTRALLENQPQLPEARKQRGLRDMSGNFETAVQENISIDGQLWQEASECQIAPDIKVLEDQLDENVVDTATKRKQCPRKILTQVIKAMKTEREILDLYKPVVNPQELRLAPTQASRMADLTTATTTVSKQISETIKSLPALIENAAGFSQVLNWQPRLELSKTHVEVFLNRKTDTEAKSIMMQIETTPVEAKGQEETDRILYRKRKTEDSPQNRLYPLQSKRKINLST
ncbi:kinetochore-associated protein NSL1 homolog [Rhinatrema bivittatum]|uniref:kinetochore-associated protein NSL1 homolog n=1 Tax=Rhinatrema bivittatum TaxID=194408 RepID=UPI0011284414|nr:kinetochore-associated protein NSL1 homolog [Rhinatrema bivittatum]